MFCATPGCWIGRRRSATRRARSIRITLLSGRAPGRFWRWGRRSGRWTSSIWTPVRNGRRGRLRMCNWRRGMSRRRARARRAWAVPVVVDGQVVPLAPTEMGVRTIAKVIPTAMDIRVPRATAFSTAAPKAESGSADNFFAESDPTLDQFTLSAYMSGVTHTCSWELLQDVPTFQQFAITDLILAIQMLKESYFCTGTGTGQAQGLVGNTGAGVTGVLVGTDNYANELLQATFDVLGKLNGVYHPRASWLMARSTGVVIRKAQMMANLFAPVWTRENGRDYLHGYPVCFSSAMPAIAT